MNFNFRRRATEEPGIDLVPFIDVLLVILIFMMLTTTYSKFTELQLNLPVARAAAHQQEQETLIHLAIAADGRYEMGGQILPARSVDAVMQALHQAQAGPERMLVISADALAPHQSVITVLEAARNFGLTHITFSAQSDGSR